MFSCLCPSCHPILKAVSWRVETAPPVIAKVHKPAKVKADPLRGRYEITIDGKAAIVEYEPDSDLRDTEQVPLLEEGGIEAFIRREVLPYTPDAWIKEDATKVGYEVRFTRHLLHSFGMQSAWQSRSFVATGEAQRLDSFNCELAMQPQRALDRYLPVGEGGIGKNLRFWGLLEVQERATDTFGVPGESSQFFLPRFFRSGLNHWVASMSWI